MQVAACYSQFKVAVTDRTCLLQTNKDGCYGWVVAGCRQISDCYRLKATCYRPAEKTVTHR